MGTEPSLLADGILTPALRILGVDGGIAHMGIACVQYDGHNVVYMGGDVSVTEPGKRVQKVRRSDDNMRRARIQASAIWGWHKKWSPHLLVYEAQSFGMKGQIAARQAATCFGILAAYSEISGVPMLCATPSDIKKAVCKSAEGRISKEQVIEGVQKKFPNLDFGGVKAADREHLADAAGAVLSALQDELVRAMLIGPRSLVD